MRIVQGINTEKAAITSEKLRGSICGEPILRTKPLVENSGLTKYGIFLDGCGDVLPRPAKYGGQALGQLQKSRQAQESRQRGTHPGFFLTSRS